MNLRIATLADVPAIERLIEDSAIALSRGFYSEEQARALTDQVFGVDTQLIADATYVVIEDDGVIVAAGGWSRRDTLYGGDAAKKSNSESNTGSGTGPPIAPAFDDALDPAVDAARIRAFFVASSHARRGLGSRLMEHCAAAAWHAGFRTLTLVATLPGVPLYLTFDFVADERIDVTLADDVRASLVRMTRPLTGPRLRTVDP